MHQIIMLAAAWLAVREGSRLVAAAVAAVLTCLIARRIARTADALHMLKIDHDVWVGKFDRRPTREQRRALRADMCAVMDYPLCVSMFPQIAFAVRRFRAELSR